MDTAAYAAGMDIWVTKRREEVARFGKFLTLERHQVQLPDGRLIDDWPWVQTPDFANIVALTRDRKFLCFRQTKYAIQEPTLALPGGFIEEGEQPLAAARRELREETGHEAERWSSLGRYRVDSNRGAGEAFLFLALDAVHVAEPVSDDLEPQQLVLLTRAEVERALDETSFRGLPWAAGLALALRRLDRIDA